MSDMPEFVFLDERAARQLGDTLMRNEAYHYTRTDTIPACPHIVSSDESTSYCDLAVCAVRERDERIVELEARITELLSLPGGPDSAT